MSDVAARDAGGDEPRDDSDDDDTVTGDTPTRARAGTGTPGSGADGAGADEAGADPTTNVAIARERAMRARYGQRDDAEKRRAHRRADRLRS